MAEGGIPKLVDSVVSGLPSFRGAGQVGHRRAEAVPGAAGGEVSSEKRHSTPRQIINFDGQQFDRYAPRGTYLNLLV